MSKVITVSISPVGKTKVEAEGFTGTSCKDATAPIIAALSDGSGEDSIEEKAEMFLEEDSSLMAEN